MACSRREPPRSFWNLSFQRIDILPLFGRQGATLGLLKRDPGLFPVAMLDLSSEIINCASCYHSVSRIRSRWRRSSLGRSRSGLCGLLSSNSFLLRSFGRRPGRSWRLFLFPATAQSDNGEKRKKKDAGISNFAASQTQETERAQIRSKCYHQKTGLRISEVRGAQLLSSHFFHEMWPSMYAMFPPAGSLPFR